jgi:signal transduction histidine kinase
LRAIGGFSRILSNEYAVALDVEGRRMLSVIESNIRKMDHLITDLLSLSRITRINGIRHKVNMEFMVRNLYDSLVTEEDREHITFTVSPMPAVLCDPIMMEHVWSNLISNAIKFTSPRIHRIIEVSAKGTRDYVEFSVRDNGVGFNPKNAGKLFEIFQRLHNAHEIEGTGVGLAIVKRVIDHHKGKVWAESKEGEGAAFYFTLPAGEESFIHR